MPEETGTQGEPRGALTALRAVVNDRPNDVTLLAEAPPDGLGRHPVCPDPDRDRLPRELRQHARLDESWGFAFSVVLMLGVSLLLFVVFRRRGWLSGATVLPKLGNASLRSRLLLDCSQRR